MKHVMVLIVGLASIAAPALAQTSAEQLNATELQHTCRAKGRRLGPCRRCQSYKAPNSARQATIGNRPAMHCTQNGGRLIARRIEKRAHPGGTKATKTPRRPGAPSDSEQIRRAHSGL